MAERFNPAWGLHTDLYDGCDEWGSVMGDFFDVAEALEYMGGEVPDEWEFRFGTDPAEWDMSENDFHILYEGDGCDVFDLIELGWHLHREQARLKREGRDY